MFSATCDWFCTDGSHIWMCSYTELSVLVTQDDKAKRNLSSSKQFFGQLQEEVNAHIKKKKDPKGRKAKENNFSSTKLKL